MRVSAKYNQYLDYTQDSIIINSDGTEFTKRKGKKLDPNGFLVPL